MTEWRLWEGDEPPAFTDPDFFRTHPRIDPGDQIGHRERTAMAVDALVHLVRLGEPNLGATLLDIGCGDGAFLVGVREAMPDLQLCGVDAGTQNVAHARGVGLDVHQDDFTQWGSPEIEADIVTLNEVLEHLVDPHGLLAGVGSRLLLCTSPLMEDPDWHYEHHAWAWDFTGYEELVIMAGWEILDHRTVAAAREVAFPPHGWSRVPQFQCIIARRR